jgi:hypothetical protein
LNLGGLVPDRTTYYAIVDELSTREDPAGIFRRTYIADTGKRDEAFGRDLSWHRSSLLVAAERGDLTNDFVEISEDEATRIVERIRQKVQTSE